MPTPKLKRERGWKEKGVERENRSNEVGRKKTSVIVNILKGLPELPQYDLTCLT